MPLVAEFVFLGRRLAVYRLEIRDHELWRVRPVAGGKRLGATAAHELLLDMIPFTVEGRAAERENRGGRVDDFAVGQFFDKSFVAGFSHQLGDPVHGTIQIPCFPFSRARRSVQHLDRSIRIYVQLKNRRAFGAKRALVVRAARIAFDVDDLPVDSVNQRGATDGAIRANARGSFGVSDAQLLGLCNYRPEIDTRAD